MTRVLVVSPGPAFSVQDVCNGWVKGLRQNGCEVGVYDLGAAVDFYQEACRRTEDGTIVDIGADKITRILLATEHVYSEVFKGWPDFVLLISGFYIPIELVPIVRSRGVKVVYLFTESPYEDNNQAVKGEQADLCVVNDPTNLELFPAGSYYQPHSYDPDLHFPGTDEPKWDFSFCGTGYQSRMDFFNAVDWGNLDVTFEGNWQEVEPDMPIRRFIGDRPERCMDNHDTADLYRASKMSANFYRRESNRPDLADGWAMGPREVELAACKTFFLRDPRPESDEVLGMLPTFSTPGEFGELLHWYASHPDARAGAVELAASAIADRTFENAARRLLSTLNT